MFELKRMTAWILLAGPMVVPFPGLGQSADNCTFKVDPDSYLERGKRVRVEVTERSRSAGFIHTASRLGSRDTMRHQHRPTLSGSEKTYRQLEWFRRC